jgi:UDPglucose 6-dehydrogenase
MNEIANLCELVGANVDDIRRGIGTDSRIGNRFLFPGVGYGGSCFPKDVKALYKTSEEYGYDFKILDSVMAVNKKQKLKIADKIIEHFGDNSAKTIAVWGLAFKPNTDDIREAPSIDTISKLLDSGFKIKAFDPEANSNIRSIFGDKIQLFNDPYETCKDCDGIAIMTEWNVFRTPDFSIIKDHLNEAVIFDGRNLYSLELMNELGFCYYSIGRESQKN